MSTKITRDECGRIEQIGLVVDPHPDSPSAKKADGREKLEWELQRMAYNECELEEQDWDHIKHSRPGHGEGMKQPAAYPYGNQKND